MTRIRRIADRDRIFFVTTNFSRNQRPMSPQERDIILEILQVQRAKGSLLLFGFVVMPDHVHVLLIPRNLGLIATITQFKSTAAKRLLEMRRSRGPLWQPRYFDNVIRRVRSFWEKLEYIHSNPVNAGLVTHADDWRWSSSKACAGFGSPQTAVDSIELPASGDALLWPL
jgi:putative transposase